MHKILFRGKEIKTGKWAYGNYYYESKHKTHPHFITWNGQDALGNFGDRYHPVNNVIVDPNTIGQFTGLCDKHGKKIFEGDIILTQPIKTRSYSKNAKTKQRLGRVIWCDGKRDGNTFITEPSFNVEFVDKEDKYCRWDWSLFYDCEVVGNIYDNPELSEANNE